MSEEETRQFSPFEQRVLAALAELTAEMNGRFDAMNERLNTLENKVDALDGRLNTLENKVDALDGRLSTVEDKVDALDGRLNTLENKVDARLRETRPIWESVLTRVKLIDAKLDVLGKDLIEVRAETDMMKQRLPPAA